MAKKLCMRGISLLLCFALAGCATDSQRTKTQGTVIGAAGGAVLLGGLGALAGALSGNRDNIAKYAIAGAVAGAALGGVAGYKWGERVVIKKEQYKNSEDYLTANIRQASRVSAAAEQENKALSGDIAQLNERLQELSAQAAAGNHNAEFRAKLVTFVNQRHTDVAKKIQITKTEISDRQQALSDAQNANPQQVAQLKAQIDSLNSEREKLQASNHQLAAIGTRIGV